MSIKQQEVLSRADFDEAVVKLRLNVSEIAKETGIPRTYLSEFRNGDRKLRPEHLGKLRDYFEGKGIEFDDAPAEIEPPHPALRTDTAPRCYFHISADVPADVVAEAMRRMDENDAQIVVLLKQEAKHGGFLVLDDAPNEETRAALQEVFTRMAENAVIFRMLRGWPALNAKPATESAETLRGIVLDTFRPMLVEVGLLQAEPAPEENENEDEEAVS